MSLTVLEGTSIGIAIWLWVIVMWLVHERCNMKIRLTTLRSDLKEMKGDIAELRAYIVSPPPVAAPPPEPPKSKRPSTRQVTTAVSDLRKWSEELGSGG